MLMMGMLRPKVVQKGNAADIQFTRTTCGEGIGVWHMKATYDGAVRPEPISLRFCFPDRGVFSVFSPNETPVYLTPNWVGNRTESRAAYGAPIQTLVAKNGKNMMTVAVSDPKTPLEICSGVREQDARIESTVTFFTILSAKRKVYEADIRVDFREIPFDQAVMQVRQWWQTYGYDHARVPQAARYPMYSTWYSFHQNIDVDEIVKQCRTAKELGCRAVIVDDGWQTEDRALGYGYCGDWQACPSKIPDMKAFADRIHELGMKFILWYSMPYVGRHSEAWTQLHDCFLDDAEGQEWCCLDPRFPQVRDYLIGLYEKAVREWDLDGFKLDFIDSFALTEASAQEEGDGRDYDSLEEAVEALLCETMTRLKGYKSDICIEFRQKYIGPLMQTYGNMLRVGDCPADALSNRIGMVKLRLLSGSTAVHSDMLMWHEEDTPENAALQLINVLYTVPQISVLFDTISAEQKKMLGFYLRFWNQYREVLLDGALAVADPSGNYAWIKAEKDGTWIVTLYGESVFCLTEPPKELILINGTAKDGLYLDGAANIAGKKCRIFDCMGELTAELSVKEGENLLYLPIPPSGMAKCSVK